MQASQAALGDASVDNYATRAQIQAHLQLAMNRRAKALKDDPTGYAAGHPTVQQMMGVASPCYLTDDQAHSIIGGLSKIDTTKQKVAPIMDGLKQHYGKAWDGVLDELVQNGLPASTVP